MTTMVCMRACVRTCVFVCVDVQALARWSRLLSSYRSADLRDPRVAAAAVEDGALLVYELSADSSGLASSDVLREEEQRQEEEEGGGGDQGEGAMSHRGRVSTQTAVRRMDGIAAAVRSASPHLFGAAGM